MDVDSGADESFPEDEFFPGLYHKMLGRRATTESANTKITQFSQRTTVTICSTSKHSLYQVSKTIMTQPLTRNSYRIDRCAGQQGLRDGVTVLAPDFDKFVTERNKRQILKCKRNINPSTFNVRTLQSIKQMSELTATAVTYYIDIINIQKHRFYHEDIDLRYHEIGSGWTFISVSALKNTGNSTIGGVGVLLSPHANKSLNTIEKITS